MNSDNAHTPKLISPGQGETINALSVHLIMKSLGWVVGAPGAGEYRRSADWRCHDGVEINRK